ncbi:hypothetical protein [Jiella marina]|uniref:hypothetical protein n=1 Tax=Jiella sp. LLJ827 TaxID=2917712 RepID=UPI002100BC6F|nr:hypothetical protein [Jiella sp. LLJ827]MCQ0988069.1 hypothetical protein [Jiella sp. LLJ827]
MTIEAMNEFAKTLRQDPEMARGAAAAIGERRDGDALEALATYARERGFEVSAQDVETERRAAAGEGNLSDDQLEAVSGAGMFDFGGVFFDPSYGARAVTAAPSGTSFGRDPSI